VLFGRKPKIDEFEAAAMPHLDDLYRTARRVMMDATEAEDIVQEAYLQAWKSFHRFELGTNCRAWLFKILFHVVQHHRRKMARFGSGFEDESFLENTLTFVAPIPQELKDEDFIAAMDKLPPAYREAVLLVDVEEFAYREAAEMLGIPVGTVMSRLSRGRGLLRKELVEQAAAYGIQPKQEKREQA
jgi:RNA polymerase sigma-70 factor, ECF subfamily